LTHARAQRLPSGRHLLTSQATFPARVSLQSRESSHASAKTYDFRMTVHPSLVVAARQLQDSVSFRAGIGTSIAL
jgi:hypothetical protein